VAGVSPAVERAAAALALLLLSPVLLVLGLLTRFSMGRPIFFYQWRAGRNGAPFQVVKFRTMRPGPGTDEERLTPLGRLLRQTSLDELPQLWNVLRGEMSLVGPRPLPVEYLDRYTPEQARRHEVRPGLTGWAQINGRNTRSWQERLALDVWYVDHRSFSLDLRILARTVVAVLARRGVEPSPVLRPAEHSPGLAPPESGVTERRA